jgi:hypothetical protein
MRLGLMAALGVGAALLLMACGSSGKGLISAANAGPLKSDIEAVDVAAQEGNGNCTATEAALQRTEQDFATLPASTDSGLHNTLRTGIANLRKVASELCRQPLVNTTTAPSTTTAPTTTTTPPAEEKEKEKEEKAVEKEHATEEKAKEEIERAPGAGGGTPAPGESEAPPEENAGNGAGGQESGK